MRFALPTTLSALALASTASAQSFNIDFGPLGSAAPSSDYGGAGLIGHWNVLQAEHLSASTAPQPFDEPLRDLDGNPTPVGVHQFGGMALLDEPDPSVGGNVAALLTDARLTHSPTLETCLYFNGLETGTYEVLVYAWRPNHPSMRQVTRFDFVAGSQLCGGAWGGGHEEGVTYTRTIVPVTNGFMGPHIGVAPGANAALGAAACGMQIRKLSPSIGSIYCTSATNSTGQAAQIEARGSLQIAADDLTLHVTSIPANVFGFFVMADTQDNVPMFGSSQGTLCLGQPIYRFSQDVLNSGLEGYVLFQPQLSALPQGVVFQPGETWNFQYWFRDSNPVATSNTSNAIAITYQ